MHETESGSHPIAFLHTPVLPRLRDLAISRRLLMTLLALSLAIVGALAAYAWVAPPRCDVRAVLSGEMHSGSGC